MSILDGEPILAMSAFSGLLAIRLFRNAHPEVSLEEAIVALRRVSPDDGYHDYERALILNEAVDLNADLSSISLFFRSVLTVVIEKTRPWWLHFASFGRERLREALNPNEAQCFEVAGLFSDPPGADVLGWWDTIAQAVRADEDSRRLMQGREAERLTIAYETDRLTRLGINSVPQWVALDDNCAGYDVHSFDKGIVAPVAKLIEVKSSARHPPEIFLTKNEWDTALEREPNYRFHIWLLPEEKLIELRPRELADHIPENRGSGEWTIIRIVLPSL